MPSPSSDQKSSLQSLESIDRQMNHILISIERLERTIDSFKVGLKAPKMYLKKGDEDLEKLLDEAYETGYNEGYEHGADDVYNTRLAEVTD